MGASRRQTRLVCVALKVALLAKDATTENSEPPALRLADGRALPELLFATDVAKLRANVGDGADDVLAAIKAAGQVVYEVSGSGNVWEEVSAAVDAKAGVVILGGYDVLPAARLDVLPPNVRRALVGQKDHDNFEVWSDQAFGDADGDGIPDKPVSRIPDGHSIDLLRKAVGGVSLSPKVERYGLRNTHRPFADEVFKMVPGIQAMLASEPVTKADVQPDEIDASWIYQMLHGSAQDTSKFWGESSTGPLEAIDIGCLPELGGGVVFAASCYGALLATEPANSCSGVPTALKHGSSFALEFLAKGARAYIGCTGAHYSPAAPPYDWGSPDLHRRFWKRVVAGAAPADALFQAKIEYMANLPYFADPDIYAIMLKPWGQFTCLGLGW